MVVSVFLAEMGTDESQILGLRTVVRSELVSQGLDKLTSCDGLKAIPFLQVCVRLCSVAAVFSLVTLS